MPPTEFEVQQLVVGERIGGGSFGDVHEGSIDGHMPAGMKVAIKISHNIRQEQEAKEWQAEIDLLTRLEHPNIIKLHGYAQDVTGRYLVYEFMELGSLSDVLEDLDWAKTKKVAQGSAAALMHLHQQEPPLVFRDLKASNILIDQEYNAKLSDFGLVKAENERCYLGTKGCTDPYIIKTGFGIKSTDMYSFGIIMMQLITKRYVTNDKGVHIKPQIAMDLENGRDVLHEKIRISGCNDQDAKTLMDLAFKCTEKEQDKRPTIKEIVQHLSALS